MIPVSRGIPISSLDGRWRSSPSCQLECTLSLVCWCSCMQNQQAVRDRMIGGGTDRGRGGGRGDREKVDESTAADTRCAGCFLGYRHWLLVVMQAGKASCRPFSVKSPPGRAGALRRSRTCGPCHSCPRVPTVTACDRRRAHGHLSSLPSVSVGHP